MREVERGAERGKMGLTGEIPECTCRNGGKRRLGPRKSFEKDKRGGRKGGKKKLHQTRELHDGHRNGVFLGRGEKGQWGTGKRNGVLWKRGKLGKPPRPWGGLRNGKPNPSGTRRKEGPRPTTGTKNREPLFRNERAKNFSAQRRGAKKEK